MTYSYYEDLYNNQYRWSTKKEPDGKFHVWFYKLTVRKYARLSDDYELKLVKERSFNQRKKAKAYCYTACQKAKLKQRPIIDKRNKRNQEKYEERQKNQAKAKENRKIAKQKRLALQPKGEEKAKIQAKKKVEHYKALIKKADTKIKSLNTRKKNYKVRLKYYEKRVASMKDVYISKNRNIPKYSEIED